MTYEIEFKPKALKDLGSLRLTQRERVVKMAEALRDNLAGDVKRLTHFTPEYRLRVGDCRVLFEVERNKLSSIVFDIEKTPTDKRHNV